MKDRLQKVKKANETLNAICDFIDNEDREIENSDSFLSGKIYSIKECFELKDTPVTLGCSAIAPHIANQDAQVVKQLSKLGATPIARGNLSEFMLSFETNNLIYGRTNHPINPGYTAGGSSGGDAALVATCVDFAIASDLGGSIRVPAAHCGVVGYKPTSNSWNKTGFYPRTNHFAETMLGIGCITKDVETTHILNTQLSEKSPPDITESQKKINLYYPTQFLKGIKNKEIKEAGDFISNLFETKEGYEASKINLSKIIRGSLYQWMYLLLDAYLPIMNTQLNLQSKTKIQFLFKTIRSYQKKRITRETFLVIATSVFMKRSPAKTTKVINKVTQKRNEIQTLLHTNGLFVYPTIKMLPLEHGKLNRRVNAGRLDGIFPAIFANVMDLSAITVPVQKFKSSQKFVPGITIATVKGNEHLLFEVAKKIEESTKSN